MRDRELGTNVKQNINSVEVLPQLSTKGHPVDGALVGAGSLWPYKTGLFSSQLDLRKSLQFQIQQML
jgi:hypothetical protein